jgi:hypothetical protein
MTDTADETEISPPDRADVVAPVVDAIDSSQGEKAVPTDAESPPKGERDSDLAWDHSNRRVVIYGVLKYLKNKDIPKMVKKWLATHPDPNSIVLKVEESSKWIMGRADVRDRRNGDAAHSFLHRAYDFE